MSMLEMNSATIATEECIPCQMPQAAFAPNGNSSSKDTVLDYPTQTPPAEAVAASVAERPTQTPPSNLAQQGAVAAGLQTEKKVTGLWRSCGADRNSWMHVDGIGWRKFADNSDSAITAFNIIAAHAKTTEKGANYNEGDDGKVNILYVW